MPSRRDFLLNALKAAASAALAPTVAKTEAVKTAGKLTKEQLRHEAKKMMVSRWVSDYADSYSMSYDFKNLPHLEEVFEGMSAYQKTCYNSEIFARMANHHCEHPALMQKPRFQQAENVLRQMGVRKEEIKSILAELKSGDRMLEMWESEFMKTYNLTKAEYIELKSDFLIKDIKRIASYEGAKSPEDFIASKLDEFLQMTPEQIKALREKPKQLLNEVYKPRKVFADMASAKKGIYPGCKLEGYGDDKLVNTDAFNDYGVYFNTPNNTSCESKGKYTNLVNQRRLEQVFERFLG